MCHGVPNFQGCIRSRGRDHIMLIGRFVSNIARCAMTKLSITLPASVAAVFGALAAATDMMVTFLDFHVAVQLQRAHAPCAVGFIFIRAAAEVTNFAGCLANN